MKVIEKNTRLCLEGNITAMHTDVLRTQKGNPEPMNVLAPLLVAIGGNEKEVLGYANPDKQTRIQGRALLQEYYNAVAIKLAAKHPKIEESIDALKMPRLLEKKYTPHGKKQTKKERTAHKLRFFLNDYQLIRQWQDAGYFDWDDGQHQLSLVAYMGWMKAFGKYYKPLREELKDSSIRAFQLLGDLQGQYPKNGYIPWMRERYKLSWMYMNPKQLEQQHEFLPQLNKHVDSLLVYSTQIGSGIKYNQPEILDASLSLMENKLGKNAIENKGFRRAKKWSETLHGRLSPKDAQDFKAYEMEK